MKVFDWFLPEDHQFYMAHKRSINNVNIIDLIVMLTSAKICSGISTCEVTSQAMYHVAPVAILPSDDEIQLNPYSTTSYQRSLACALPIENTALCNECSLLAQKTRQEKTRKQKKFGKASKVKST